MLTIRSQQMATLARAHAASFLLRDFTDAGMPAVYDASSAQLLVGWENQPITRLKLDDGGRIQRVQTPLGRIHEFNFIGRQLRSTRAPSGLTTVLSYDDQDRPIAMACGNSRPYTCGYDDSGEISHVGFPDATCFQLKHTAVGKIRQFDDRAGNTVRWEYDDLSRPTRITDPLGNATIFQYGCWDLPDSIIHPDGNRESFDFDPRGALREIRIDDQPFARLSTDNTGRPLEVRWIDGHFIRFAYDSAGHAIEAASPTDRVQAVYDDRGRVVRDQQGDDSVSYEYDPRGQLAAMKLPGGDAIRYEYDADGRLAAIVDWNSRRQVFEYGTADVPTARQLDNGLREVYRLDELSQYRAISIQRDGQVLWGERYERDAADRIIRITNAKSLVRSYQYDTEGRVLSSATAPAGKAAQSADTFQRNANGNIIARNGVEWIYSRGGRLLQAGNTRYEYDDRGNRVRETGPSGQTRYTYNGQNLLTRADLPDGRIVEFTYDAFARRTRKTCGGVTTRYLWSGHQMIRETRTHPDGATESIDYLFLPGTHKLLALRAGGQIFYCHTDHLGTPKRFTGEQGNPAWRADHDVLGAAGVRASTFANPWRFPGHYFDEETGLHYNRARHYDPQTGVYLSVDPIGFAGGVQGINPYAYADNDPIHGIDPLGLWSVGWSGWVKTSLTIGCAVVAGALIGTAAALAAPVVLGVAAGGAIATGIGVVAGGIAAGATGYGVNAAMTDGATMRCVGMAALRGAGIGAIASLPFLAIPLLAGLGTWAGVAAMSGLGGASGALSYVADYALGSHSWSTSGFIESVALVAATAGLGRFAAPRLGIALKSPASDAAGSEAATASNSETGALETAVARAPSTSAEDVAAYLKTTGELPDNFITKSEAKSLGWDPQKGNLNEVAPGKSIGGDVFGNKEGRLPEAPGRVWHEADTNYTSGFRGSERILYSSDGLIFKTTDHYKTFTPVN